MRRAVQAIDRYDERAAVIDAWLFGICRHVVLDELRAMRHRAAAPTPPDPPAPDPEPLEEVVRESELAAVRSAFARLRDADRELLELRVVGQFSAEEVGAVLHKRPGAVRMAQARALARLRTLLDDEERAR
jgi:RNA polymerase sigma-70 factor (ECF subfamily)